MEENYPMIQLQSISFGYSPSLPLFDNYSWEVSRNDTWAILGSSGCGKSTLLYLLSGLQFPDKGKICFDGRPLTRPRPQTGLILQDYGLLPWATVRENAELGMTVRNFYGPDGTHAPKEVRTRIDAEPWLEKLGISGIADKYPSQISGGQRQRTAIARTLALHPDVLLMDEPFSSLDTMTREDLQFLTLELCHENQITMVLVTHSIEEAAVLGKRVLLLGSTPHTQPVIFENPQSGNPEFQRSGEYQQICQDLRQSLEQL